MRLKAALTITKLQTKKIQDAHECTRFIMDAAPMCSMLWDRNNNIFGCTAKINTLPKQTPSRQGGLVDCNAGSTQVDDMSYAEIPMAYAYN